MRRIVRTLILVTILLSPIAVGTSAAQPITQIVPQAPSIGSAFTPAIGRQALDCTTTPFGRVLNIGAENEIFVGFRSTGASPGRVRFDRLDASGSSLVRQITYTPAVTDTALHTINTLDATVVDATGDGKQTFIEFFFRPDNFGQFLGHSETGVTVYRQALDNFGYSQTQIATFSDRLDAVDDLVIAYKDAAPDNSFAMFISDPITGGGGDRTWRSYAASRVNFTMLDLAVGDLDGDGSRDDVVAAFRQANGDVQILVLTPDPSIVEETGADYYQYGMRLIGFTTFNLGTPQSLRITTGDVNGDGKDEIIYAQEQYDSGTAPQSVGVAMRTFSMSYNAARSVGTFSQYSNLNIAEATTNLSLAAGDTDRDGLDEIVIGFRGYAPSALNIRVFDGQANPPTERNRLADGTNNRNKADALDLAIGDMDRDGYADIVAGFNDNVNALQVVRIEDRPASQTGQGLIVVSSLADSTDGRSNVSSLVVRTGDSNNDSLKAKYSAIGSSTLKCDTVTEANIASAIFTPPYWRGIQIGQEHSGTVGQTSSTVKTTEMAFTTTSTHSVSAYFGVGIDGGAAAAQAKITGGYEFSLSNSVSNGDTSTKSTSASWSANDSFVVTDQRTYNCYSYQPQINGVDVDGAVRFCQHKTQGQASSKLNEWDSDSGPLLQPNNRNWAPITRDWASLTLFKQSGVRQSDSNPNATRAIDGNTDGAVANNSLSETASGQSPWWQIDLGKTQDIRHVLVWNRTDTAVCGNETCRSRLKDFYVFVSDVDPATISNDPSVLKLDPRIKSYYQAGIGSKVTNFLTMRNNFDPIEGRYVRVQLAGSGVLSLAEVQIFGSNQVNPDQYPTAVRENTNGLGQPIKNDGYFLATMYNPVTKQFEDIRVRGNLLWDGIGPAPAKKPVFRDKTIGVGGVTAAWSLYTEQATSTTIATSLSNSVRVGAEFEAEAGLIGKISAGAGYEYSSGISTDTSNSIQWGTGFELGGAVQGFPDKIIGISQCHYSSQPFYYEVIQESSYGYSHRMLVLDYIVPDQTAPYNGTLNRSANLDACNIASFSQPVIESNYENGAPNSHFIISGQGFTPNTPLKVEVLLPGATSFSFLANTSANTQGGVIFLFTVPTGFPSGTYRLRVSAVNVSPTRAAAQEQSRELILAIQPDASIRSDQPVGGATTISADGTVVFRSVVTLPFVSN